MDGATGDNILGRMAEVQANHFGAAAVLGQDALKPGTFSQDISEFGLHPHPLYLHHNFHPKKMPHPSQEPPVPSREERGRRSLCQVQDVKEKKIN